MKKSTIWIAGTLVLACATYLMSTAIPAIGANPGFWTLRGQFILLSGVLAFAFMTLDMLIAARPAWLDRAMGGLDKGYAVHKWAGIFVGIVATLHYLGENAPKWAVGWGWLVRPARAGGGTPPPAWESTLIHTGIEVGEWAFYIMIVLVIIALVQAIPYRWFRYTHKLFPLIYIAAAYHSVAMLFKAGWWSTPAAYLIIVMAVVGTVLAVFSLFQRIGRKRRVDTRITGIDIQPNGTIDLKLDVEHGRFEHAAGQFAFLRFEFDREPHPFTIASSGTEPGALRFVIKPLGDFTGKLATSARPGQHVSVEGPYGEFRFDSPEPRQVWVGGGIGISPFMSKVEQLAKTGGSARPIDLWYSTRTEQDSAFPDAFDELCQRAGVTLHRVVDEKKQRLSADLIRDTVGDVGQISVWFCGPQGFAESLRKGLVNLGMPEKAFHNELFAMR